MTPELLAAAVSACGEGATDAAIVDQLVRFSLMLEAESPVAKRVHRVMTAQRFVADLVAVEIESSSTRAILTLRSDSAESEDGLEQIRTDRTDTSDGRHLAAQASGLIGRRVLVFKQMEDAGPQKKVRVCVHLVDIGPARGEVTPSSGQWMRRHWEEAAASAGVTADRILEAARHYAPHHNVPAVTIDSLDRIPETVAVDVRRWLDKQRARGEQAL